MKKSMYLISSLFLIFLVSCKAKELSHAEQMIAYEYTVKIEKPDFTFTPNRAQTLEGRSINVGYSYHLKISKDTIEAELPYFGRAHTAPINSTNLGINFISTNFKYTSVKKKNGIYEIKIEPKDLAKRDLKGIVLFLNVSDSGYGNLNIQSTNRQNVSFYGGIK